MDRIALRFLLTGVAVVAVLAAACAPAAKPGAPQPGTTSPATTDRLPEQKQQPAKSETTQQKQAPAAAIPAGEQNAKPGGVIVIAQTLEAPGYIPWEEAVTTAMQPVHTQSNLIVQFQTWGEYDKQDYWNVVPDLAKSWEQSPDGLKWTFRFQQGVPWHDGKPFTCADAKWTLDTIRTGQDLRRSPRALLFQAVSGIECPDDLTMVVTLKRPYPAFLEAVAMGPNMVWPKHVYQGKEGLDKLRAEPKHVGTGPFVLSEFVPGEKWVYQKNPGYWNKPYPYLDGIELRRVASSAVPAALRAGRLDTGGPSSSFSGAQADTLLKECTDCQFFGRFASLGFTAMQVNFQRPPWNTQEIRDAIGYAVDQVKQVNVCTQGWGIPGAGIIHPDSPYAIPKEIMVKYPGYNIDDPEGNKAKARDILAKAGYRPGELVLRVPVWSGVITPRMPCLIEDLTSVGFKVEPTEYETARMYDLASAGDFDIHPWGYLYMAFDPDFTLYEHFYTGSDRNYGRYSNPEVDRLIDLQSQTLDPEQRKKLIWQVSEIVLREQAKLFLQWSVSMPIVGPRVKNFLPGPTCTSHGPCMRMERVWLDKK